MPKVSVIVPIYNVEQYLKQALDSLKNQTLEDIEVICVNDGSTDGSLEIIKEYVAADPRFVLIDKENRGYGHSMNRGIEKAMGDYIGILEPDDFLELDAFEKLYGRVKEYQNGVSDAVPVDIVRAGYWSFSDPDGFYPARRQKYSELVRLPKKSCLLNEGQRGIVLRAHLSIWAAIYRKGFLDEKGIRFHEVPGAGWVDNPFAYQTISSAQTVVWDPGCYYNYRVSNEGASSFLKDANIPLDRLAETAQALKGLGICQGPIYDSYIRRLSNYTHSIINGMKFDEYPADIYRKIVDLFKGVDHEAVKNCDIIKAQTVRMHEDFTGITLNKFKQHDKLENPELTFVVPAHEEGKYIGEALLSVLKHDDVPFDVLCVTKGASTDYTDVLLGQIADVDGRVSIVDVEKQSWTDALRTEKVVFLGVKRRFGLKSIVAFRRLYEKHATSDFVVFNADLDKKTNFQLEGDNAFADIMAAAPGRFANVLTTRTLLRSIAHAENELLSYEGRPFFVRALLSASFPETEAKTFVRGIPGFEGAPSIRKVAESPLESRACRVPALIPMFKVLDDMHASEGVRRTLQSLAANYMAEELENRANYKIACQIVKEYQETYLPLLGDYLKREPVAIGVPELLHYIAEGDLERAFYLSGTLKASRLRKSEEEKQKKIAELKAENKQLKAELKVSKKKVVEAAAVQTEAKPELNPKAGRARKLAGKAARKLKLR